MSIESCSHVLCFRPQSSSDDMFSGLIGFTDILWSKHPFWVRIEGAAGVVYRSGGNGGSVIFLTIAFLTASRRFVLL